MSMIQIPPYWKPARRRSRHNRFMALMEDCGEIWSFVVLLTVVIVILEAVK